MNEDRHKIKSIESYEELISAQKKVARLNASLCVLFSTLCVFDACAYLNSQSLMLLILSAAQLYLGAKHFLYYRDGNEVIKYCKERVRELKK